MNNIPLSILPYLEEISQCLWNKNASIMIGAGFSMNAKAIFENAKPFPLWQDLGNAFYKKVRGEEICNAKYSFFDPLKLAYEVESNFGRSVLDSILRSTIPDGEYKPSELHQSLLSLPWTDVFTTNYDTLLERAADLVSERNYKVVVHKDNLIHSVPPRIVKLHGCFSASTPLIISEEDYRTYPQKYAPFVNTVQQTLLENTLCLIGFSGDDPNFLKWIGWIRDNLGSQNAPRIYLIGSLSLSSSQEKTLSQYNITCVDMSLCEGVGKKNHQAAIKTFIDYCESRKKGESYNEWELNSKLTYPSTNHMEKVSSDEICNELVELISLWKDDRKSYPKWLVTPYELRLTLWSHTKNWSTFFDSETSVPAHIIKEFIYEFLWRKEKSLLPIFDNEVKLISESINIDLNDKSLIDGKTFHIILSLLRYYREEGKIKDWDDLFRAASEHFIDQNSNDYLTYEKALFFLFENKAIELTNLLSVWASGNSSAVWMYRKASILAEVNKLTDARDLLEKALIKTRRKINSSLAIYDLSNISLESYILVLLTNVNYSISIQAGQWIPEGKDGYLERLNDLKQYQCNPIQEMQLLELEIKHEPSYTQQISISNGFDIGSRHTTHNFSFENKEALNAFRFLRFFEDAALPFSLPRINIAATGAKHAIKRTAKFAPYWSMCTMLRTRDVKSIEIIFTREALSELDTIQIENLAHTYIGLLSGYLNEEKSLYEYGLVLPEALSRLCCRLTITFKDQILELIQKIYSSRPHHSKYQSIDKLIKRLILSYSNGEIIERIEKITKIAYCLVVNEGRELIQHFFPNPFDYFINLPTSIVTLTKNEIKISSDLIRSLLNAVESDNIDVRKNSSFVLIRLNELGFLNKNQVRSLLSKLLTHVDEYGLPDRTNYFKFAYINIFSNRYDVTAAFKRYLLASSPIIQSHHPSPQSYAITGNPDVYTTELIGGLKNAQWSNDELHVHAQKLLAWWKADKFILEENSNRPEIFNEIKNRFSSFVECIDLTIVKHSLYQYKDDIRIILTDLKSIGFNYLNLKSIVIEYLDIEQNYFLNELNDSLSTFKEQDVLDAFKAINRLLLNSKGADIEYYNALANYIRFSNGKYLDNAFQIFINLLDSNRLKITPQLEEIVITALGRTFNDSYALSFEDSLELKKFAARLASKLYLFYSSQHIPIPNSILLCEQACCAENTFSEIRNQWVNM